jgi:hypothetical protein
MVKQSTIAEAGLGLFATADIAAGNYIMMFSGVWSTKADLEKAFNDNDSQFHFLSCPRLCSRLWCESFCWLLLPIPPLLKQRCTQTTSNRRSPPDRMVCVHRCSNRPRHLRLRCGMVSPMPAAQ